MAKKKVAGPLDVPATPKTPLPPPVKTHIFTQAGRSLREFEDQGYPVEHLYISPKFKEDFEAFLRVVDGVTILPINGKEYEVRDPMNRIFGNVVNYIDGQEEGVFLVAPGGDKISLLPSSLEDSHTQWM